MMMDYRKIDNNLFGKDHNYIVSYNGLRGEDRATWLKAINKKHAETKFRRIYNGLCKVTDVQTIDEWIDKTSTEVVSDLMKTINEEELCHLFEKEMN